MSIFTRRRITLIVTLVAVITVIWFLEGERAMGPGVPAGESRIEGIESVSDKASRYPEARELVGIADYLNSSPFKLADFIGERVILIDFWTYSCINCQRTTPYVKDWWDKYEDDGLLIVGVHTPEFEFEKDATNVQAAMAQFGVTWPVVQDNDYATWRAYGNQYWPRKYLIDVDGYIVYDHIGEGAYGETEERIRQALAELKARQGVEDGLDGDMSTPEDAVDVDFQQVRTREIYLGASRNEVYLGNARGSRTGTQTLELGDADTEARDRVYLGGTWEFHEEFVRCLSGCRLRLAYSAKQVNIVAGDVSGSTVRISLDGALVRSMLIGLETLYTVIEGADYGEHILELEFEPGLELYTFTFG
jgi:thiol-disulfide isomerase/thioredoxin